jgi:hypothetical protein
LFAWAASSGNDVAKLKTLIQSTVPSRAGVIDVQVGEWSLNSGGTLQFYSNLNAVWTADVLGHILANGGLSLYYGTKGNALKWSDGYVTDSSGHTVFMRLDDPQAPYWGHAMFTGAGLFRPFGSAMVPATTTTSGVDVFASNAKTIVVVNKNGGSRTLGFSLPGLSSHSVDVWQKNQSIRFNTPPVKRATVNVVGEGFTYSVPAISVTTFVLS